ncbi:hypothetical protein QBC40DRAFT_302514, partial [Triangularia verruculosa]
LNSTYFNKKEKEFLTAYLIVVLSAATVVVVVIILTARDLPGSAHQVSPESEAPETIEVPRTYIYDIRRRIANIIETLERYIIAVLKDNPNLNYEDIPFYDMVSEAIAEAYYLVASIGINMHRATERAYHSRRHSA